jgi:DNA polymerase I-like protein with 3'-5' exonuclease and polymerase domains
MEDFFFGYVMKLMPLLLKMEMRGMRVDLEKREEVRRDLGVREKELEGALGGINVRSSKQVQELLYTKMGLPKQYDHKKGTVTAGKKALEKLREKM